MGHPSNPLVSTQWLDRRRGEPDLKIVDAPFYLPGDPRTAQGEYDRAHIPGAALFDLLFGRPGRPLLFYSVLRLSERFDLWLNVYGAADKAEMDEDGLFGASRAGSDSMLGKLEEIVRHRVDPEIPRA